MSVKDMLLASIGLNIAIIAAGVVFVFKLNGRLSKLEEWARLMEKRINGKEE